MWLSWRKPMEMYGFSVWSMPSSYIEVTKQFLSFLAKHTHTNWQGGVLCRDECAFWRYYAISKHSIITAHHLKRMQKCRRLSMKIACRHSSRRRIAVRGRADAAATVVDPFFQFVFVCIPPPFIHCSDGRSTGAHILSLVEAHRRRQLQRRVLSVIIIFFM